MKISWIILFSLATMAITSFAQTQEAIKPDTTIFINPISPPSFPGGTEAMMEYIKQNTHWSPVQPPVKGRVFVEFYVDVDGTIKEAKIIRGLCESCDKEALRIVSTMPTWIAGTMNGKAVKLRMVVPVAFGL